MNGTRDTNETTAAGNGDGLDPQAAAVLLEQAKRQARRRFEPNPPVLSAVRAIAVFAAYGGIWLSVRGQHPYKGPSGWAVAIAYALVAIVIGATVAATRRAAAGVGGRSLRQMRAGIAVLVVAWISVYVFQGALHVDGVGNPIVYGMYPATAPLMIVGLVGAAFAAAQENWRMLGSTLTVAVVASVAGYAGAATSWLIVGIGLFVALVGNAVATAVTQRA
jgi:hypothetical protein